MSDIKEVKEPSIYDFRDEERDEDFYKEIILQYAESVLEKQNDAERYLNIRQTRSTPLSPWNMTDTPVTMGTQRPTKTWLDRRFSIGHFHSYPVAVLLSTCRPFLFWTRVT